MATEITHISAGFEACLENRKILMDYLTWVGEINWDQQLDVMDNWVDSKLKTHTKELVGWECKMQGGIFFFNFPENGPNGDFQCTFEYLTMNKESVLWQESRYQSTKHWLRESPMLLMGKLRRWLKGLPLTGNTEVIFDSCKNNWSKIGGTSQNTLSCAVRQLDKMYKQPSR